MSEETPETQIERRLRGSLPEGSAPEELWERIEAERAKRVAARPLHRRWLVPAVALGTVAAMTLGIALLLRPAPRPTGWTYLGRRLNVGDTVTADPRFVYMLREATIGNLALLPGTRLRIIDSSKQKRLKLEQGKISAVVKAPPRLFAVETNRGVATDLGCSYELETNQVRIPGLFGLLGARRAETLLHVRSGWVELADNNGGDVLVPAGASCQMTSGSVGLPYFTDKEAPEFLHKLPPGYASRWPVASIVRGITRPKDTLTLYYLLPHVPRSEQPAIWNRLLKLVPPTKGITREDLLAGKPSAISTYLEDLKEVWNPPSPEFLNQLIDTIRSTK